MADVGTSRFACEACGKSYTWKPELAGKKVKCKCGQILRVPQAQQEPPEDDLYDLAPSEEPVKPQRAAPPPPITPSSASTSRSSGARPLPARAPVGRAPAVAASGAGTVPYFPGPTLRDRERLAAQVLVDMKRDVYTPVILLVLGFLLYVGYYGIRYQMGGTGIAFTTLGLGLITAFKAALLIGFAFAVAGPLGVSFGGIYTAILKLAAIAVFCDGVTTWIDAGVNKISGVGGGGVFGFGVISFPIALGLYWGLLTYLFSMDPGDSWMVVMILSVFDYIVRLAMIALLLRLVLGWGGVAAGNVPVPAFGGGGGMSNVDPVAERVAQLKDAQLLKEAREFIAGGRQEALRSPVDAWYAAGCPNVWFEVSRDINGKVYPDGLIVELPKDKTKRAECYNILNRYYQSLGDASSNEQDDGSPYIIVPVQ